LGYTLLSSLLSRKIFSSRCYWPAPLWLIPRTIFLPNPSVCKATYFFLCLFPLFFFPGQGSPVAPSFASFFFFLASFPSCDSNRCKFPPPWLTLEATVSLFFSDLFSSLPQRGAPRPPHPSGFFFFVRPCLKKQGGSLFAQGNCPWVAPVREKVIFFGSPSEAPPKIPPGFLIFSFSPPPKKRLCFPPLFFFLQPVRRGRQSQQRKGPCYPEGAHLFSGVFPTTRGYKVLFPFPVPVAFGERPGRPGFLLSLSSRFP